MFSTPPFPDRWRKTGPQFPGRQGLQSCRNMFVLIGITVGFSLGNLRRREKK